MMDDQEETRLENSEGPGSVFVSFTQNDELVDKLKLLNYEKKFVAISKAFRVISRYYFVNSVNPGEQFFMFTSLAGWLIQQGGNGSFEMPQEFDDPNATISRILNELRSKNITIDFAPNKLKSGAGMQCLYVLNSLADLALIQNNFAWQIPTPQSNDDDGDGDGAGADEAEMEAVEEKEGDGDDQVAMGEDDDEVIVMDLEDIVSANTETGPIQGVLHSDHKNDVNSWRMEVERVAPSLKVTIRQDLKDWRMHIEQMSAYRSAIGDVLALATPQMEALSGELSRQLEKVNGREKYLNQQLDTLLSQFRGAQDRRADIKQQYREASGGVTERTNTLQLLSEEVDQVKQQIDEQGAKNSDGAPMVRLKQALGRLEQDLVTMEVQIGVIEHSLLQSQLRDRLFYTNNLYTDNSSP